MIRVSGPEAFRFCRQICDRPLPGGGGHKYVRLLRSVETQEVLDEAVVSVFKTPHSYTGEDVVEFSAHGSPVIVAEILDTLYRLGIRPAKPGEFTLRAFLNQKIDLTQAEAVADLIAARTQDEVRRASRQLRGGISESAQSISDQIVKLLSSIELEMDFVEEDVELMPKEEKRQLTSEIIGHLNQMLAGYQLSRRLREGVRIVISGAPNVGKSTLFNALTGQEKAIVHETPGTTRDVIEATSESRGVVVTYLDTAGIRITSDAVEDEGVKRARREVSKADLIIRVVSRDVPDSEPDDLAPGTETIQVVNKYDLNPAFKPEGALAISAKTGFGLDELKTKIYQLLIGAGDVNSASVSRERHYNIVTEALAAMSRAEETLNSGYTSEIIAEELRDALAAIDALTGKKRLQGLLNEIFSNFCIGK